ncbi:MAG TPA: tRNA (N6-threonylcarbamoyladenosine(37)-N6)-methyltransferase TrmO [Anaerolineae bacterium]|nr:tRNA (N6-threonylcarbamoyladenosine(37)-N6)-methyltransferase TrmO [Anaerolineae bacterium]
MTEHPSYRIHPIGHVRRNGSAERGERGIEIEIAEAYRPALLSLDHFTHVVVLWWADRLDGDEYRTMLQGRPPYAEQHLTGVFATRAPYRPNPVAITTCRLLGLDQERGVLRVAGIDAHDGTPVVDLKAYFPVCDRVRDARIPEWLEGWPEWMPDDGLSLEEWEQEA